MVNLEPSTPDPFEIIVGTYEQYLLGYKVENIVNEYKMEKSFATHSHLASIRSVASSKHYLASAGADDSVCLYDMRYRKETGKLMHHNDTINCVAFTHDASHLFTCSDDGTIAAIRCGNWQVEKHWFKAHNGSAVNTLAIHPSGKLALSTGADGVLRTWNLIKGRQAYATNLVPRLKLDAKNITVVKWSPNGEKYLLAANQRIDIYSVELAAVDDEIRFDSKIVCVEFLRDDLIAVGLENGQIKFYDLEKSAQTVDAIAHDIRVKCMAHNNDLLVTASSSGEIKLWRFTRSSLDMLQSVNCGTRVTCLALAMPCEDFRPKPEIKVEEEAHVKKKRKFRPEPEVIIEQEGEWKVTDVEEEFQAKYARKELRKKKRLAEGNDEKEQDEEKPAGKRKKKAATTNEIIDVVTRKKKFKEETLDDEVAGDQPKKKKKKKSSTVDSINNNVVKKQRDVSQENTASPNKKKKKFPKPDSNEKSSEANKVKTKSTPSSPTVNDQQISPANRKKKATCDDAVVPVKRKKRKHSHANA